MNLLLIEDDLSVGRALQSVLQDDGHRVVWVRLAAAAEQALAGQAFDAALLDLGLPDRDGGALLQRLRAGGGASQRLPVLVISARDSLEERLGRFADGADDYLVKPFDVPELLARLRAVVRRAQGWNGAGGADGAIWRSRDLVLDERRLSLTRDGAAIALSKTEFTLLHALIRETSRVVTRTELEERALPHSTGVTLDIHMSNLRKKLGDGYIRTVRGVGYLFLHNP